MTKSNNSKKKENSSYRSRYTTVIIPIDNKEDLEKLEAIKELVNEKTACKALLKAARLFPELSKFKKITLEKLNTLIA